MSGNVCLNILRDDWKPVFGMNHVIFGLLHLFRSPNMSDPLNKVAGHEMFASKDNGFKSFIA